MVYTKKTNLRSAVFKLSILIMKLPHLVLSVLLVQSLLLGMPIFQWGVFAKDRSITSTASELSQFSSGVTLKSKTVRWRKKNGFSGYGTVRYPVVTSLRNTNILKKIQTAISVESTGQSLNEYQEDAWLSEIDYTVNYNQNSILDLTYSVSGSGAYPSTYKKRLSVNLKTGNILRAEDLFRVSTNITLAQTIEKMMQQEIQQNIAELQKDYPEITKYLAKHHFQIKNLSDFTITRQEITFYYDFGFAHAIKALEPSGAYFLSYDKLNRYIHPDGAISFALKRGKK
jgi:hypothetical protein